MNQFTVARYRVVPGPHRSDYSGAPDLAVPVIDGTPLFEMLDDRAPGVPFGWLWPPSGHWMGSPTAVEFDRVVVLDGTCGMAECCGVVASIVLGSWTVVWEDFYSPGAPDVPDGLRFEFVRGLYEKQLAGLGSLDAVPWAFSDEDT